MTFNPTLKSPLAPGPLSPSAPAALHLLTRQSVTPLSQNAFVRKVELLLKQSESTGPIPGGPTRLDPAAGK